MKLVFSFEGCQVRTTIVNEEPWFVANDICSALEIGNVSAAVSRLDEDEKGLISIDTLGGAQSVLGVNEPGLYELIMGSRKKEAKNFKRWVKHDVLPSIRKNGAYMTSETIEKTLSDPDFIINLATRLKEETAERLRLKLQIDTDRPKVVFAEALETSRDSILVADLAKLLKQNGIDTGEQRLFGWLRENGYLIKSGSERNMPTQRSMELMIMEIKIGQRASATEGFKQTRTPKITGKGQIYFINKFKQLQNLPA